MVVEQRPNQVIHVPCLEQCLALKNWVKIVVVSGGIMRWNIEKCMFFSI